MYNTDSFLTSSLRHCIVSLFLKLLHSTACFPFPFHRHDTLTKNLLMVLIFLSTQP